MKNSRPLIIAVAAIVLIGLFLVLRPKDDTPPPATGSSPAAEPAAEPIAFEIDISDGNVAGVEDVTEISQGAQVTITVVPDVEGEAHLHGYEILEEATPEAPAVLEFVADEPGRFELAFHSHDSGDLGLTLLEVA